MAVAPQMTAAYVSGRVLGYYKSRNRREFFVHQNFRRPRHFHDVAYFGDYMAVNFLFSSFAVMDYVTKNFSTLTDQIKLFKSIPQGPNLGNDEPIYSLSRNLLIKEMDLSITRVITYGMMTIGGALLTLSIAVALIFQNTIGSTPFFALCGLITVSASWFLNRVITKIIDNRQTELANALKAQLNAIED